MLDMTRIDVRKLIWLLLSLLQQQQVQEHLDDVDAPDGHHLDDKKMTVSRLAPSIDSIISV